MGRPRKIPKEVNIVVQEVIAPNPSVVPVTGDGDSHSQTDINVTVKETNDVETKVEHQSVVSQTVKATTQDPRRITRQSDRLKRKPEPDGIFNLLGSKAKEPKVLTSKSPTPDEIILDQELAPDNNSNNLETMNDETSAHLDSDDSKPGCVKTKKEPAGRGRVADLSTMPSKQVSFQLSPTGKNTEQEAPPQVHQAADERNLVEKVDYIAQENTSPNDCPPTDIDYRALYIEAEKRVEELMEGNLNLVKDLNFANGKIDAYEKLMMGGTMGFALQLSPQRGVPPIIAPGPDTSNHHQNEALPKAKRAYKKKAKV